MIDHRIGNKNRFRHGHAGYAAKGIPPSKTYKVWTGMMARCYKESNHAFADYGGRGIKVCKRWHDFVNFLSDMGEKPEGLTLDRINNNKNYMPSNCRWATRKEQANNRRKRRIPLRRDEITGRFLPTPLFEDGE